MTTAKYIIPAALDAELNYIKTNTAKVAVLTGYTLGDSTGTITANTLSSVTSASIWGAPGAGTGDDRQIQVASGLSSAAGATGTATQLAFLDSSGVPLLVSTVTSQAITINNTVNIPQVTFTADGTLA